RRCEHIPDVNSPKACVHVTGHLAQQRDSDPRWIRAFRIENDAGLKVSATSHDASNALVISRPASAQATSVAEDDNHSGFDVRIAVGIQVKLLSTVRVR